MSLPIFGRQKRSFQGAETPKRMPKKMYASPNTINNPGDIFALAFECIAAAIAAAAAAPPVEGPYSEMAFKRGQYRRPCKMVAGSAVHEQQGLACAAMPACYGCAILGGDQFHELNRYMCISRLDRQSAEFHFIRDCVREISICHASAYRRSASREWLKRLTAWIGMACTLQVSGTLKAQEIKPLGQINEYLRLTGELYGSHESWDYFRPSPAVNNNNDYDLWSVRARFGALLTTPYVDGYAQAQYIGLYGLPDNAVASPGGPLGLGAAYFLANQSTNASNVFLKQAYLNFKFNSLGLPGAFLKIGRFEFMDGMEYRTGMDKFDSLKRARIAQRLLASNVVHVGRSFDGFAAVYDRPAFNLTVSGIRPTQGGFTVQGQDEISDINLFYAALTGKKDVLLPGTEGRIFYVNYDDKRNTQAMDNRANRESALAK